MYFEWLAQDENLFVMQNGIENVTYKVEDTEKYVYELKDNKYIETVFIKRRDGGTVCVLSLIHI